MRSVVIGFGSIYLCFVVFVICATIQINANAAVELTNAINEASYQAMIALTEDDSISTDEQLEQYFIRNSNLMLEGSSREEMYKDSEYFIHGE